MQWTVTRQGIEAFSLTIVDDASGNTICVFAALTSGSVKAQFDGTNWHAREIGTNTTALF